MDLPADIDPECRLLCEAMNRLPGIQTTSSCCGHGEHPYWIFFDAESLEALPGLLYWFDVCHCGFAGWRVIVKTDCAMSPVSFYVEGPVGAYGEAEAIADLINKYVAERQTSNRNSA